MDTDSTRFTGAAARSNRSPALLRYLHDIADTPLLSAEQEQTLGRQARIARQQSRRALMRSAIVLPALVDIAGKIDVQPSLFTRYADAAGRGTVKHDAARLCRQIASAARIETRRERLRRDLEQTEPDASTEEKLASLSQTLFATLERLPLRPSLVDRLIADGLSIPSAATEAYCIEARTAWSKVVEAEQRRHSALSELMSRNVRLVVTVALKYASMGYEADDLIQDGNLGLFRAAEKFDPERGFKFSTYAYQWIRQAIVRGIANRGRCVRLPVHVHTRRSLIGTASHDLTLRVGRAPTTEEIASYLGAPVSRIEATRLAFYIPTSLDAPPEPDAFERRLELRDDTTPSPLDSAISDEIASLARAMVSDLSAREQRVLYLRFGIGDGREHTLAEIGHEIGLTRERIRQIEARALKTLRQSRDGPLARALLGIDDAKTTPSGTS